MIWGGAHFLLQKSKSVKKMQFYILAAIDEVQSCILKPRNVSCAVYNHKESDLEI